MALTTPPSATADSYIEEAAASTYLASYYGPLTNWDAATVAVKEAALRAATTQIDGEAWVGVKTDTASNNSLRWPRTGVYNADGQALASDSVPAAIGYAVAHLALSIVDEAAGAAAAQSLTEIKVGSIGLKYSDSASSDGYSPAWSSAVDTLIAPFRVSFRNVASLVRA